MTPSTISQFFEMYGTLLLAAVTYTVTIGWALIKMYFRIKALEDEANKHKEVEQNLTALINRNKEAAELATTVVQQKLESIGNTMVEVATNLKWLMNKTA